MNRRRLLCLLAALAAACGREPPAPTPPPAAPDIHALRVLAFGDSLTAGKDLEDPDTEAYPAVLERRLRAEQRDVRVINAGHSGDTTYDALARLDFSLEEKPHVVIVALGSNDTFQGKPLADIEKNLEAIVRRSQEAGAVVVLCGMRTFPNLGSFYTSDYTKMFGKVARRRSALLVPFMLEGVAGDPAFNLPDGIHPNPAGQRRVAENLLPDVRRALERARRSS